MKTNVRKLLGGVAVAAIAMSAISSSPALAKGKSARIDPSTNGVVNDPCKKPGTQCDPRDSKPSAERNKSARLDPPTTERGIKDQGVKSGVDAGETPPSAERNKSSRIDPPTLSPAERRAGAGPGGGPRVARNKTGWIIASVAAAGALAAVLASGNNDDNPTSP
jgi:hypothetical protein